MSLARDLFTVLTGRLLSQAVLVGTAPVLTRLFLPAHFGAVALLTSTAMVLRPLSLLRYEMAVAQARDEAEAGALMGLCLLLGSVATALTAVAAWTAGPAVARAFGAPEMAALLPLLPLVVAAQALMSATNQWAAWRRRFGPVARSAVVQSVFQRVLPIPFALLVGPSGLGLYVGQVLGQVVGALSAARPFLGDLRRTLVLERGKVRAVASLHRNFPRHLTVAAVLEMVALMTPAVVLGWFWSVADVGLYGQAYGLLNLPLGLFLDAVGRTFYPHLAQLHHRGASLAPQMKRMLTLLADLGCYPLGAVVVCGPALFGVALGPAFRESGGLARLMVPMFLPWLMWSPLSSAVNVLGLQRPFLRRVAALTATRVAVLVAVPLAGGSMALTIGAWAGCAGALMVAQLAWILRTCGVPLREAARIVGARCLAAAIALAPAAAAAPLGVAWQAAALAAGAVAYALWALRASPDLARRLTHRLPAFGRALR